MAFADFFKGREPNIRQAPRFTPQQTGILNQLASLAPQAQEGLSFQPIAEAAQQRFAQQTAPQIGEIFGGAGAKRSSGFSQSMANAMRDLQTQLAGQEAQFGLQRQAGLSNLLQMGLQPQFESIYEEGTESPFGNILSSLLPLLLHGGAAAATGGASVPFTAAMHGGALSGDALSTLMSYLGGGK